MQFNLTPTDPLGALMKDRERELFNTLSQICARSGASPEKVADAGLNLLCNAIRQGFPMRAQAESTYDELVGRMKTVLLQHYDSVTGRRKHNFAWDQNVEMPFHDNRDNF